MMLKKDKGISICIPNWNHRTFLGRSVGSARLACVALRKSTIKCEILIVDDYSRDGSAKAVFLRAMASCADEIRIVMHSENQGLAAARNTALMESKYQTICFLDADNELEPENLVLFYKAITETNATITYGNLIITVKEQSEGLLSNDILNKNIYLSNYIDAFCLLNAGRIIDIGGYYGKHANAHEDWELLLHAISENEKIVFVPAVLGRYHVAEMSMIKTTDFNPAKMHRVFSQRGAEFPLGFDNRIIYYPGVGYL